MIAGCDCDLHKLYIVREDGLVIANGVPSPQAPPLVDVHLLLYEIAGAKDYTADRSPGIAYNKRRWTIWNVAVAVSCAAWCDENGVQMLVAPSSAWTKGYNAKVRQTLIKADAANHDLRECQAMIGFYKLHPECWVPLPTYLETL